jgi:hypothetical protein
MHEIIEDVRPPALESRHPNVLGESGVPHMRIPKCLNPELSDLTAQGESQEYLVNMQGS